MHRSVEGHTHCAANHNMEIRAKKIGLILILIMLASLPAAAAGCAPSAASSSTAAPSQTTSAGKTDATSADGIPEPITPEDLAVEVDGKVYGMLDEAAGLIESLGEPVNFSEAPSCLYEGTDKTYEYDGLILYTITQNGKELVDGIDLTTGRFETRRGIKVGSTSADIIMACGDAFTFEADIVYVTDENLGDLSPRITFVMENDVVSMISIYSGSNNMAE